jgi:hypothetical protein
MATSTVFGNGIGTYAFNACVHSHTRNWMAQPFLTTPGLSAGFGNAVVGYGYAMTGTTDAACALATVVTAATTGSMYVSSTTSKTFTGA